MKIQLEDFDERLVALQAIEQAKAIAAFLAEAITREDCGECSLGAQAQYGLDTILQLQSALLTAAVPTLEQSAKLRSVAS